MQGRDRSESTDLQWDIIQPDPQYFIYTNLYKPSPLYIKCVSLILRWINSLTLLSAYFHTLQVNVKFLPGQVWAILYAILQYNFSLTKQLELQLGIKPIDWMTTLATWHRTLGPGVKTDIKTNPRNKQPNIFSPTIYGTWHFFWEKKFFHQDPNQGLLDR